MMLRQIRLVVIYAVTFTMFITLAACGATTTVAQPTEPTAAPVEPKAVENNEANDIVVYSGRSEDLVSQLFKDFEAESGLKVQVRYGDTAAMAATILEEGDNSPADLFFGQDAGALGALAKADRLMPLPTETLNKVDSRFRSADGLWLGVSGRARVVVYNPDKVTEADLPDDIFGLCDPKWQGKIGWAPSNGSFQAFVTALRVALGEDKAREWLTCMVANGTQSYPKNPAIIEAVSNGEIVAGLVNHYYILEMKSQNPKLNAKNYTFRQPNMGGMVNLAGVGVLKTTKNQAGAMALVNFLLSEKAQTYFNEKTFEYPLAAQLPDIPDRLPLKELKVPDLDLNSLNDLEGTLKLLQEVKAL